FLIGLLYCFISFTPLQSVIYLKRIKLRKLLPLIAIGLSVAMLSNYISDIIAYNFSLTGISFSSNSNDESWSTYRFLLEIVDTAIVPAVFEEFAFRGIILNKLRKFGDNYAIIMSAVLFGLMHGNLSQIPFAFILGLVIGFVAVKTNSIIPGILIHFFNNLFSVIMSYLRMINIFSSQEYMIIHFISVLAIVILGLVSVIILCKDKEFFSLNSKSENDLSLKSKISVSFLSVGMIFFIVVIALDTLANTISSLL
ncbi:MAG: lysostaphin resistance A-like protein, partial [Ruminococcus sp.]